MLCTSVVGRSVEAVLENESRLFVVGLEAIFGWRVVV